MRCSTSMTKTQTKAISDNFSDAKQLGSVVIEATILAKNPE